jgi:hypothetical protein
MYFRVTGAKIQLFDDNGRQAAGYEVYTYAAGTTTAAASYSDRLLTVPNTNPIVLDARGEADLYTGVALKLVFTIPGGDPTSPIWEVDYVGEQQANYVTGMAVPVTVDNHYIVNPTPAVAALTDNLQLTFIPDIDNLDTIGTTTFTPEDPAAPGPNDMIASGPYLGSGVAVFHIEIDTAIEPAPAAPTVGVSADAGLVTAGDHYVKVTALTVNGETLPGTASAVVTAADSLHKIDCSVIPTGSGQVIGRNIYMTESGAAVTDPYYLVSHSGADTGPLPIAGLSRAAACVVTWTGHGLSTNDVVVFAGITQDEWVALNSYAGVITWIDVDSFSIAVDTSGYAAVYDPVVDPGVYVCPTIPGHVTTTYKIGVADASLTVLAPTVDTSGGSCDTITWQKDGGTAHPGIPITAAAMTLMEGFTAQFATIFGHVYGDTWATDVVPASTVNLNGLGDVIVYKNKNKVAVAIDGGDMLAGYPAQLIYTSTGVGAWLLLNPATPTFNVSTISAIRYRKNITVGLSPYTLLYNDQGYELSCVGDVTITLLAPSSFANRFVYIKNAGTGLVTVDAGTYAIQGYGASTLYIAPGQAFQLVTNGVDWHILTSAGGEQLFAVQDASADSSLLFSGLLPNIKYRLVYELTMNTGVANMGLQFNEDTGNTYNTIVDMVVDSNSTGVLAEAATSIWIGSPDATRVLSGEIEFHTFYGIANQVKVSGNSYYIGGGDRTNLDILGDYTGADDLSKVSIITSANDFTGRVWLYYLGQVGV